MFLSKHIYITVKCYSEHHLRRFHITFEYLTPRPFFQTVYFCSVWSVCDFLWSGRAATCCASIRVQSEHPFLMSPPPPGKPRDFVFCALHFSQDHAHCPHGQQFSYKTLFTGELVDVPRLSSVLDAARSASLRSNSFQDPKQRARPSEARQASSAVFVCVF